MLFNVIVLRSNYGMWNIQSKNSARQAIFLTFAYIIVITGLTFVTLEGVIGKNYQVVENVSINKLKLVHLV